MPAVEVVRAYRFPLDLSHQGGTEAKLRRHAGAARWAYNYALNLKQGAHRAWGERRDAAISELSGWTPENIRQARSAKPGSAARRELAGHQRQATAHIKPQLTALSAPTQLLDHHRKLVFQMTSKAARAKKDAQTPQQREKAEVAYAKLAATDPIAAADYEIRRARLEHLQDVDPEAFAAARAEELKAVRRGLLAQKQELIRAGALTPTTIDVQALWRATRDKASDEGGCPWYEGLNVYAFLSGFDRADRAWKNWQESCAGRRTGRPVGYPRFKRKSHAKDSFSLCHDLKNPGIRLDGYRRLHLPGIGSVRLHQTAKRLGRLINRGQAAITSVTISREGHRWYASVLSRVQQDIPDKPTRRQRTGGLIAMDLGSQPLAKLSAPLDPTDPSTAEISNPKYLHAAHDQLARAQRALSRCAKRSKNRVKAQRRVGRLHHQVALRRASYLHGLSKLLVTSAAYLAFEELDITSLTKSARGTEDRPGLNVAVRSRITRHLLDAGLRGLAEKIAYKAPRYGSTLIVIDKGEATSKCAKCGERNPSLTPSNPRFTCGHCGHDASRRDNAVGSIYKAARRKLASAAPDRGSALKAPGEPVSPAAGDSGRRGSVKGEGPRGLADPSTGGPPQTSNGLAIPTLATGQRMGPS